MSQLSDLEREILTRRTKDHFSGVLSTIALIRDLYGTTSQAAEEITRVVDMFEAWVRHRPGARDIDMVPMIVALRAQVMPSIEAQKMYAELGETYLQKYFGDKQ